MTDITKGGRGKKAPYESTHCRVPLPLKPLVDKLALAYKEVAGFREREDKMLKDSEDAIARALYPTDEKPVNKFNDVEKPGNKFGLELVQEYLESLGLEEMPVDEKGKVKARYDQLGKFKTWLENK